MKPKDYTFKKYSIIHRMVYGCISMKWVFLLIAWNLTFLLSAQVVDPFTLRAPGVPGGIYTLKGDFTMLANKNLTAATYDVSGANDVDMRFVDVDTDPATFNSSTGELKYPTRITTPECATIKFAGLYWTGRGNTKVVGATTVGSSTLSSSSKYWYTTSLSVAASNGLEHFRYYYDDSGLTSGYGWFYLNGASPYTGSNAPAGTTGLTSYSSGGTKYYKQWSTSGSWTSTEKQQVLLKGPSESTYSTINSLTADCYIGGSTYSDQYSCFADVTAYVKSHGLGNYTVANVKTQQGRLDAIGSFGGWGMIIVYEHPDEPMRNIAIFDGYAYMQSGGNPQALPISGFRAVQTGPVNIKMGLMAGEGDVAYTGDQLFIVNKANIDNYNVNTPGNWTEIPNPRTGALNNYFNSSVIMDGSRTPNQQNNYGFDAHMYYLNNTGNQFIDNNQTKTAFKYTSSLDQYIIFLVAMSVDAYTPEPIAEIFDDAPIVGSSHQVDPGVNIIYNFDVKNQGTEGINNLVIKIPVPYNTTYAGGLTADFSALPSGTCYDANSISYSNDTIRVLIEHVPGPQDVGSGSCSITGPWDENKSWAHISFKLKATDRCAFLQSECARDINTIGYLSGTGSITATKFNVTTINGWTSGACTVAPKYGPNPVKIGNVQLCIGDDAVEREYCAGTVNIPLSDLSGNLPPGTYEFYTANSSWVQIGTTPLTVIPGDGYYLAIPINNMNPNCTSAIKVRILVPALLYRDRIYVKEGYCSNGIDWAHPMGDIQLAMKYARKEVWVAAGTYDSEERSVGYANPGYILKDSIKIYGGFRADANDVDDNDTIVRNPLYNPTILKQPTGATVPIVSSPATVNVGTVLNGFYIEGSTRGAADLKNKITMMYCVIRNNSTGANPVVKFNSGGGVVNSLITANTSTGGIMNVTGSGSMHFSTLVNNTGTGVIGTTGNVMTISNSIIWGNSTAQTSGTHTITYSAIQSLNGSTYGLTTNNNIALDPVNLNTWGPNFGNAPATSADAFSGFWLNFFSRLKAVGNNSAVSTLGLKADLKRSHRIKGANVDMGAFESRYLLTPAANIIWTGNTNLTTWPPVAQQGNPEIYDFIFLHQGTHAKLEAGVNIDGLVFHEGIDNLINNNTGVASMFTGIYNLNVATDIYYARRFSPNKWHFLYVPYNVDVAGGVLDSLLNPMVFNSTYSVRYYDGIQRSSIGSNASGVPGKNWRYITEGNSPTPTTLAKNKGYNFAVLEDRMVYLKANSSANNRSFLGNAEYQLQLEFAPLSGTAYDGDQGFNLFGIPYSSFYRPNGNISLPQNWYETKWKMYNVVFWNTNGDGFGNDKYIPIVTTLESKLLPPFSALFVEIPGTPGAGDYILNPAGREYNDRTYIYTPENVYQTRSAIIDEPLLLGLNVIKDNYSDRAVIVLSQDGSLSFEVGRDMGKFGSSNAKMPQLSMVVDGKALCINEIPPQAGMTQIPLRVYVGEAGTYRINLENNPKIADCGYRVVLEDTQLGTTSNIIGGDYEFTSAAGTFDNRFVLNVLKTATAVETPQGVIGMSVNDDQLTIKGIEKGNRIEIFDVAGRILITSVVQQDTETFGLSQKGVYFVKIYQATGTVTKKVNNE